MLSNNSVRPRLFFSNWSTRSSFAAELPAAREQKAAPLSQNPLLIQSKKPLPLPVKEPKALFFIPRSHTSGDSGKLRSNVGDKPPKIYSKSEVSLHNKRTDCWIIIKDRVYDVTSYVEEHPGGDAILDHAGDDSTEGFFGPQHATRVFDMIEDFYIGDLEQ